VIYHFYLIYDICHAHISDISLCLHIILYIEYNHFDAHDMICTQHPIFSKFYLPLHSYRAIHYHSEEPYL
jgi:hypothetical protein